MSEVVVMHSQNIILLQRQIGKARKIIQKLPNLFSFQSAYRREYILDQSRTVR